MTSRSIHDDLTAIGHLRDLVAAVGPSLPLLRPAEWEAACTYLAANPTHDIAVMRKVYPPQPPRLPQPRYLHDAHAMNAYSERVAEPWEEPARQTVRTVFRIGLYAVHRGQRESWAEPALGNFVVTHLPTGFAVYKGLRAAVARKLAAQMHTRAGAIGVAACFGELPPPEVLALLENAFAPPVQF